MAQTYTANGVVYATDTGGGNIVRNTSPLYSAAANAAIEASNARGAGGGGNGSGGGGGGATSQQQYSTLFGTIGNAAQDYGQAQQAGYQSQADLIEQTGYAAEGKMYSKAASIANENAVMAGVSGAIQQYQAGLTAEKTIGSQQADVAANGLSAGGSAGSLARSSIQQSNLEQQLISTQTQLNEGGYFQQAAAADAEAIGANTASAAAGTASAGALALQQTAIAAGNASVSNSLADISLLNTQAMNFGGPDEAAQLAELSALTQQVNQLGPSNPYLSPSQIANIVPISPSVTSQTNAAIAPAVNNGFMAWNQRTGNPNAML